jgi:hypothetical protein
MTKAEALATACQYLRDAGLDETSPLIQKLEEMWEEETGRKVDD